MMAQENNEHKNILFLPINSPGHTNGSIALADRLRNTYQYKCIFVVTGESSLRDNIKSRGHGIIELKDLGASNDVDGDVGGVKMWSDAIAANRKGFTSDAMVVLKTMLNMNKTTYVSVFVRNCHQYEAIIERYKPALVILDNMFPVPYLLTQEGRAYPWVRIHSPNPNMVLRPNPAYKVRPVPFLGNQLLTKEERVRMREQDPERWQAMLDEWKSQTDAVRPLYSDTFKALFDLYENLGLKHVLGDATNLDAMPIIDSPHLNIYLYPEALDYTQDDDLFEFPKRYVQCNSLIRECLPNRADQERWLRLIERKSHGKRARILFSFGTLACGNLELMRRLLDLFALDQKDLYIVSKGIEGDKIELDPDNMVGENYIPQPFLLQHVDLAIIHGGNNGLTECMHYGVPTIVVPLFGDQFDNAQRVEDLQVGKRLDPHSCSGDQLMAAIDALLGDEQLRARLKEIGAKMRARDDVGRVSKLLHELALRKQLDEQTLAESSVRL